jgi:hypothetical protein
MPHSSIRPGPGHTSPKNGAGSGFLCSCRASHWHRIFDSTPRVVFWGVAKRLPGVCSSILFGMPIGDGSTSAPADFYMQLAVHDLIGALFAPSDPVPGFLHADKLFKRICHIIRDHFADLAFGPCEVAAEAGISLRYLQKFFTARGTTCTHFINSVRLDHAARLLVGSKN